MSDFLSRWSRRKAADRRPPPQIVEDPAPELPPIETLCANSDFTVFLARGVSTALQTQALRIAWASDPAIANFRGMAEYDWDFNAPGYGDLAPGDDAVAWLKQVVRSGAQLLASNVPAPAPEPTHAPAEPARVVAASPPPAMSLVEPAPDVPTAEPFKRRHGSALPV